MGKLNSFMPTALSLSHNFSHKRAFNLILLRSFCGKLQFMAPILLVNNFESFKENRFNPPSFEEIPQLTICARSRLHYEFRQDTKLKLWAIIFNLPF